MFRSETNSTGSLEGTDAAGHLAGKAAINDATPDDKEDEFAPSCPRPSTSGSWGGSAYECEASSSDEAFAGFLSTSPLPSPQQQEPQDERRQDETIDDADSHDEIPGRTLGTCGGTTSSCSSCEPDGQGRGGSDDDDAESSREIEIRATCARRKILDNHGVRVLSSILLGDSGAGSLNQTSGGGGDSRGGAIVATKMGDRIACGGRGEIFELEIVDRRVEDRFRKSGLGDGLVVKTLIKARHAFHCICLGAIERVRFVGVAVGSEYNCGDLFIRLCCGCGDLIY